MKINFLSLVDIPIYEQLQLEEALLRTNEENWCLVNYGSPPAIVLGISAKTHLVVNKEIYLQKPVPIIRRFSGGGTVYVDENTIFTTFIFNQPSSPDKALAWTKDFYQPVFSSFPFHLKENDYTNGEKKFGGNAQYFRKNRFLHHTSFLYDYEEASMNYLLYPPRTPTYRSGRSHSDFLTKLIPYFQNKEEFVARIKDEIDRNFTISIPSRIEALASLHLDHRKTTSLVKMCSDVHDALHEHTCH